ncbi:MAG: STAS domain-containing protein [Planctomycetes bacterium]|nr:STAS domain-containing protein [Planctomycetota bacterium]
MIQIQKTNETVIVTPQGQLDASCAEEFRQDLLELVQSGEHDITIDLKEVDIMDSKGLSVFIVCHKSLSEKGGKLTVVTDNEDFRGLFHVMRLDEQFTVCGSETLVAGSNQ